VSPPSGEYESGLKVTLSVTAASGYTFDYWDGAASGSSTTVTVTMDSNKSITAHFKAKELLSATYWTNVTIGMRTNETYVDYASAVKSRLSNGSSQTITVTKVEIFDEHGNIVFTASDYDIVETGASAQVDAGGKSFLLYIGFGTYVEGYVPREGQFAVERNLPSLKELEDWQVKWYCSDSRGSEFIVIAKYIPKS
jgi:uncharacterized repeat protein (TIGR02543 family)